jgi:hypothetical protein
MVFWFLMHCCSKIIVFFYEITFIFKKRFSNPLQRSQRSDFDPVNENRKLPVILKSHVENRM